LGGLKKIGIKPGIPIRPTLAERLPKADDIIKKIGKCAVEAKYDGFRFQIHKDREKVMLYSRQSENITEMFPEIVAGVKKQVKAEKAILEGEALAVNDETGDYYPFQVTITRKRKYGVKELSKELPLKLFLFDVMFLDGKNLMSHPFQERREKLEKLLKKGEVVKLTQTIVTENPEELEDFFEKSIEQGLEGIIAKDLKAKYIAGARKFAWIKLKRSYKGELQDTVDLTIIGYFKGKGKRTQFGLGALLTACYDQASDSFKSVAKIGTGITEKQLQELEGLLSKLKKEKRPARVDSELVPDVWVQPKYVIEIRADEITKSPLHTCGKHSKDDTGYALRFPRMISVRTKKPEEATSEREIIAMYKNQKHVSLAEN
jgi:DNA ligase-1